MATRWILVKPQSMRMAFTAVTDVAFDIDGSLLVTEFSNDLATLNDVGYARSGEFPGRLVRWRGETATTWRLSRTACFRQPQWRLVLEGSCS